MVKLNKIYTRTGDDGSSGLVDGSRVSKAAPIMEAIGIVDEANSAIGHAMVAVAGDQWLKPLMVIQNDLFDLGADIAMPSDDGNFTASDMVLRIADTQVARLETEIDAMNANLGPLRSFILPGGSEAGARLHVARAAVRRAERALVGASETEGQPSSNPAALRYLNRLSDYLFVMARAVNAETGTEVLWVPGASR